MKKLNVLVIGDGAREHAITWKLLQSPRLGKLYVTAGSFGRDERCFSISASPMDIEKLVGYAKALEIDLTVVGPEDPLNAGIVDAFEKEGLRIFGPRANAAIIESSKLFAKQLMEESCVPTAKFKSFTNYDEAKEYVEFLAAPFVVKVDGLALGKGAYVCFSTQDGLDALRKIMIDRVHGEAGEEVIVEDFLPGREVSAHALCDGKVALPMIFSEDHKQAFDGDKGPNTGGMGTYAPVPWIPSDLESVVNKRVLEPVMKAMAKQPFVGLLYPGLMVDAEGNPSVLEFNCRFGDPETEVLMRLLKSDLLELFEACVDGTLSSHTLEWHDKHAVCVVLASEGYPGKYTKNREITGLDKIDDEDIVVFHAGTMFRVVDGQGYFVTNGGRVLMVTAIGDSLEEARSKAYSAIENHIYFDGMHYRKDIGMRLAIDS